MKARMRAWAAAAALLAGPAGRAAPLGSLAPLPVEVAGETRLLTPCRAVSGDVPAEPGFQGALVRHETLATLPRHEAIAPPAAAVAAAAPVCAGLSGKAAEQWLSPMLGPVEVWSSGPLGELEQAALAAREAGDHGRFGEMVEAYWRAMEQALRRRAVHERQGRGEGVMERGAWP